MKRDLTVALFMLLLFAAAPRALSQSADELHRLETMDKKCLEAREAKLRVIQQEKVEECVNEPPPERGDPKTRADCERYWRDYGWGAGGEGGRTERFFTDLPECIAAFEARENYRTK